MLSTARTTILAAGWVLLSLSSAPLPAQEATTPAADAKGSEPAGKDSDGAAAGANEAAERRPIFYLTDGSKVAGEVVFNHLTVKTRYGTLKIPIAEVTLVRFSPRPSVPEKKEIATAFEMLLGTDKARRREGWLVFERLGRRCSPFLKRQLKSDDADRSDLAEAILDELRSQRPENELKEEDFLIGLPAGRDDEVVSERFTVRGMIQEAEFSIKSTYGNLKVHRDKLVGFRFSGTRRFSGSIAVTAQTTVPNNWMRTRWQLEKRQLLNVQARGTLLQPNYNLTVGPQGTTRYSGSTFKNFPMLSLVGKIGKKGKPFMIGQEFRGRVRSSGTLYLGIVPFRRNYAAQGSYQVKVEGAP